MQRRLKRLREDNTNISKIAVVDPKRVGFGLTALITVELERDCPDRVAAFKRRALADDQVQQCYCVAGETDFVIIVLLRNMEDYEAFTARFFEDPNVQHYRASIVVSRVKTGNIVPLG